MSSISPLITFKGGICEVDVSFPLAPPPIALCFPLTAPHLQQSSKPYKVHPQPTPGYIYLYTEDGTVYPSPALPVPSQYGQRR
jgi:26S proteasome regulatory subunit N13